MGRTDPKQAVSRLEIHLLGTVEVLLDGRRLRVFNSLRMQRFIAMIALRPELRNRARLAFELWPDSDEAQARTNLRKLLHEVRQSLPDFDEFIEMGNETVALKTSECVEVDVWNFLAAVDTGNHERAEREYTGELLPACYDEWLIDERFRLQAAAHAAIVRLAEQATARHDYAATIAHTQRLIGLEPTDEMAAQFQMKAYVAIGDRTAALRTYHRYAAALERELAVSPGESIDELYQRLRDAAPARTENQVGDRQAHVAESSFVGRRDELNRLDEAWNNAREGGAHLVLIVGEPGIGKTRLAHEFGRWVRADGYGVLSARAYEAAGRPPWGPIVDLLRSEASRTQIDTLEPVWRNELAGLLPELLDASRPATPTRAGDPAQRYRLLDAVRRALTAGGRPRLLIIDDLQWCDAETIDTIGFIIRAEQLAPILIVGSARSEEVSEEHPLRALIDALTHDRLITSVALNPLDEAATATLAAKVRVIDAVDPEFAARLWSETEGNPLFVIEALRAGFSETSDRTILTSTMRAVLGTRLAQLTDSARRLSEVGAVIGRPFSIGLLAAVTGTRESELVDHVDELWRRRIIRDQGTTYDFSHDKLREVALEMTSPARRRQLHRAVAEAIELQTNDTDSPRLAAHYDNAGLIEPAIAAYRIAGAQAVAVSAFDEAVAMFRRALSLLAELPASSDRDALELDIRIALGSPLVALDGYGSGGARQLYERALSLCQRLGRPVDPPILRGLGLAQVQGCRFNETSKLAQALLDHELADPVTETEGRYLLGVSEFWRGDLVAARRHLVTAIDTYQEVHRDQHLILYAQDPKLVCLVRLALVILWQGDASRADETARTALEMAVDLDHLMTLWYVLTYAAMLSAEVDDSDRLAELLDESSRLERRFPLPYLMIVLEALQGWLDVRNGSSDGIEKIERSVERSRAEGEILHLTYCLLLLARARAILGDAHAGAEAAQEGISWTRKNGQHYLEAELWRVGGELAHQSADVETAAASLVRAREIARAQGADWLALRTLNSQVRLFPADLAAREQLLDLIGRLPSGHDFPAFHTATRLLRQSE